MPPNPPNFLNVLRDFLSLSCRFSCEKIRKVSTQTQTLGITTSPLSDNKMKKSGLLAAYVAAASATAVSVSSSSSSSVQISHQNGMSQREDESSSSGRPSSTDKFAPRFDGLRFIETLVTAHR